MVDDTNRRLCLGYRSAAAYAATKQVKLSKAARNVKR
jgi:hypothetical protein